MNKGPAVSETRKLWREWKQGNTSKKKYTEAKIKSRRLFTRPNAKQKGKDLEMLYKGMIRNVIHLKLQIGWVTLSNEQWIRESMMKAKNTRFFFISNTFISNARLKLAKIQANAQQHPVAEFCYLKIIHILHPRYQPEIIGYILINKQNKECVCIHEII